MVIAPALVALASVIALWRVHRETNEPFVEEWAHAHALTLTGENRCLVRWYLHTARLLRTWGVLGGLFLAPLAGWALGAEDTWWPVWIFAGYLTGALYAEVALVRPAPAERPVASLVPRELCDYLPNRLVWAQRILGVLVGGAGAYAALNVGGPPWTQRFSGPGVSSPELVAVAAVACGFGLEWLQRWIVRRPQPFTSPSLVAADDAIRAQAVHSIAGSGLAVLVLFASFVTIHYSLKLTLALLPVSLYVCLYYGHRAWRVPRALPTEA